MPSQQPVEAQQSVDRPSPDVTRRAASLYFSLTISFIRVHLNVLLAARDNRLRFNGLIAGAALRIQKAEQFSPLPFGLGFLQLDYEHISRVAVMPLLRPAYERRPLLE